MRFIKLLAGVLAALPLLPLTSVQASIVSVAGSTLQIASPASIVQNGGLESFTHAAVFGEMLNVVLTQAAAVDVTTTGLFDNLADLTPGSITQDEPGELDGPGALGAVPASPDHMAVPMRPLHIQTPPFDIQRVQGVGYVGIHEDLVTSDVREHGRRGARHASASDVGKSSIFLAYFLSNRKPRSS